MRFTAWQLTRISCVGSLVASSVETEEFWGGQISVLQEEWFQTELRFRKARQQFDGELWTAKCPCAQEAGIPTELAPKEAQFPAEPSCACAPSWRGSGHAGCAGNPAESSQAGNTAEQGQRGGEQGLGAPCRSPQGPSAAGSRIPASRRT